MLNKNIFWKWLSNFWSILTLTLYLIDFFSGNKYNSAVSLVSVIYISLLGLYVGSKEFDRWTRHFSSKARGEIYVLIWTVIVAFMAVGAFFTRGNWHLPSEMVTTYIAVMGVYAISLKSKRLNITYRK